MIGDLIQAFQADKRKDQFPTYTPLDPLASQSQTISSNIANVPGATALASKTSLANQDIVMQMLAKAMPWLAVDMSKASDTISSMISGEVSKPQLDFLRRQAASSGVSGGFGSELTSNKFLRDVGRSSMDQSAKGLSAFDTFMQTAAQVTKAPMFNVGSMFMDPTTVSKENADQNQLAYQSQVSKWSLPGFMDVAAAGLSKDEGMVGGIMSSVAGGGGGGGGGGGL